MQEGGDGTKEEPLPPGVAAPKAGASEHGTFYVDPDGNVIPTPVGGSITGSPDGEFVQARDSEGKTTGVRIDGPHNPRPTRTLAHRFAMVIAPE
jgi:hypothetical protein